MAVITHSLYFVFNFMWIAVFLSIIGNILVIKKNRWGFMIWVWSNLLWIIDGWNRSATPQVFLFALYTLIALSGFFNWKESIKQE